MSSTLMIWMLTKLVRKKSDNESTKRDQKNGRKQRENGGEWHEGALYLSTVMKEALRLHLPVPLIHHETTQKCTMGVYEIETRTSIYINIFDWQGSLIMGESKRVHSREVLGEPNWLQEAMLLTQTF